MVAAKHIIFSMVRNASRTYENMVAVEEDFNEVAIFLRNRAINNNNQTAVDAIEELMKGKETLEKLGMAYRRLTTGTLDELSMRLIDHDVDNEDDDFNTDYSDTIIQEMFQDLSVVGFSSSSSSSGGNLMKVKAHATELGMKLCWLVVDFCFLISDEERVLDIIGLFKAKLEPLKELETFMVSKRLLKLFEIGEKQVRKYMSIKNSIIESSIITEAGDSNDFMEKLFNEFIDQCFADLMGEILNLEQCMCEVSRLDLDRVQSVLNLCEKSLNGILKQIRLYQKPFGNNEFLNSLMKLKVLQIWKEN